MAFVVCNDGELMLLDQLVAWWNGSGPLYCRLFKNDVTPAENSVLADFTQADFDGYAADILLNSWAAVALDVTDKAKTYHPPVSWLQTGVIVTNNIYGYLIYNAPSGKLLLAERDPAAPIAMDLAGKAYNVTINPFQLFNAP